MISVNKVTLVGRMGKDPSTRNTNNGDKVVSFSVATSESWRDKSSGERKEKTEWHNIVVWNETAAKFVEQYARKGDEVYIEGQLQTRKWTDKDGVEKYSTEVVVPRFGGVVQVNSKGDRDHGPDSSGGDRTTSRSGGGDRGGSRDSGYGSSRGSDRGGDRRSTSHQAPLKDLVDDDIPF